MVIQVSCAEAGPLIIKETGADGCELVERSRSRTRTNATAAVPANANNHLRRRLWAGWITVGWLAAAAGSGAGASA